jgi:hypothetical protein
MAKPALLSVPSNVPRLLFGRQQWQSRKAWSAYRFFVRFNLALSLAAMACSHLMAASTFFFKPAMLIS